MSFSRQATAALTFIACVLASTLEADTVYLKNGSWIDGRVRARNQKVVEIEIGKIGKMEINAEEIYEIEKNNRTGEENYQRKAEEERNLLRFTREGKRGAVGKNAPEGQEEGEGEAPAEGAPPAGGPTDKDAGARKPESPKPPVPPAAPARPKEDEKSKIDPELKARIEGLITELQRQKPQYRTRAERHLRAIGQPALPFLLPLVSSDSELTRVSVFHLFYDFGDESVIDASIEALLDENEYVRDYANKTLQRVTHEDFGFEPGASPRRRENAQEKWKKWWENEKQELAKERGLSEQAETDAQDANSTVEPDEGVESSQKQGESKS